MTRTLPWGIGGGALLFYLLTLCHWISLNSLGTVSRVAGWHWQPELGHPLTLAVFAPFKLLPATWLPLALNLVTAATAALVLVQIARSVAILRHDVVSPDPMRQRTAETPLLAGPHAWLPPALAVLAGGLQIGFWEHATSASGEMLSLLCFAAAWRCVLEYRLEPKPSWLARATFLYTLGMTDNWLLLGYLPVFGAGIIWARGYGQCLDPRFLLRLALAAALGLSLYLLLPALLTATAPDHYAFWPVLKAQWSGQKQALLVFRTQAARLLALSAVLPFLLLAVRWRSHTVQLANDTRLGVLLTRASGHFIHALFFLVALWMALDPALAPRALAFHSPLLPYHYTWALVVGYGAGYLLIFAMPAPHRPAKHWPVWALRGLAVLLPALLVWKNLGDIRLTNGPALHEFARQLYEDLPAGRATVLSDDLASLFLLQAECAARGPDKNPLWVDTHSLPWPEYQRRLARDFGPRWPERTTTNLGAILGPGELRAGLRRSAALEPVVYLHPSSGLFLEDFTATSHGWIQRLSLRSAESALYQNPAPEVWSLRWTAQLAVRAAQFEHQRTHAANWTAPALKLSLRANETVRYLGGAYAKALNHWGVQLRRTPRESEAPDWFRRAIAFDPENLSARINLECATRRAAGDPNRITLAWVRDNFPALLAHFESWADVISRNGPVDEPTFLLHTGRMYLGNQNPRQALETFERSAALAPDWPAPRLGQAQTQNLLGNPAGALALTADWPALESRLKGPALGQLLRVRGLALWSSGQTNAATDFVAQFTARHMDTTPVVAAAADLCTRTGQLAAELQWRELLQQREPNQPEWLVKLGHAELRAEKFEAAITTLTRALTLASANDSARLFRAVAELRAGRWDDARRDYEVLLRTPAFAQSARFGLGNIAWQTHDTNALIQFYQAFLSNHAALSPETELATRRLKEWTDEAE